MGNHASRGKSAASVCKVVLVDGSVAAFDIATPVAELMREYPQQFVVDFRSLRAGNRPLPLPAAHKLEGGQVYVMLPAEAGTAPELSPAEAQRVLSRSRSLLIVSGSFPSSPPPSCLSCSSMAAAINPLVRWWRSDAGVFDVRREDARDVNYVKAKTAGKKMNFPETPSSSPAPEIWEMPDYIRRQRSRRLWRPNLHPIEEKAPPKSIKASIYN